MKIQALLQSVSITTLLLFSHITVAASFPGPVSWGAFANTAIANCTPACSGIITDGDSGISSAYSELGNGSDKATAEVFLSNTSYTPELKVFADTDRRDIDAFATGVQSYTNLGAARTIVLDLELSANVTPQSPGFESATARVGVFSLASLGTFYTDLGTQLEGNGGDLFGAGTADEAEARLSISGVNSYATPVSTTISFFVESGQDFLIWAGLQARVRDGGTVDATNTFTIDIFEADGQTKVSRDLLDIASLNGVSNVPLPAGIWLFGTALIGFVGMSRRRKVS